MSLARFGDIWEQEYKKRKKKANKIGIDFTHAEFSDIIGTALRYGNIKINMKPTKSKKSNRKDSGFFE